MSYIIFLWFHCHNFFHVFTSLPFFSSHQLLLEYHFSSSQTWTPWEI
jgi:hypothetical protein